MLIQKQVDVEVTVDDVAPIAMEASPFDRLSLIIRLARTIAPIDLESIAAYMGIDKLKQEAKPIHDLASML